MAKIWRLFTVALILGILLWGYGSNNFIKKGTSEGKQISGNEKILNQAAYNKLEKKMHIVFVSPITSDSIWLETKSGFEQAAEEYGFRGEWVGPTVIDVNEMIKQIQIAIAVKADGIITQGMNPEALAPYLKKADDANIPVVVVNSDIPGAHRLAYLGTNPIQMGTLAGNAILERMQNKPIYAAYMVSALNYEFARNLVKGYESVLKNAPGGYHKLAIESCKSDALTALQKWRSIFSRYPEINVVINCAGEAVVPSVKAVDEMKLKNQVLIIGLDNQQENLNTVRSGDVYLTMTQNFYRFGYQAAKWLVDFARTDKKPAKLINDSDTMIVTKENVGKYLEDLRDMSKWE